MNIGFIKGNVRSNMQKFLPKIHSPILRPFSLLLLFMLLSYIHIIFLIGVVIMTIDVRSRWYDYLHYRNKKGTVRELDTLRHSWCTRGVAEYIWPDSVGYYRLHGYRFYHIFPDGTPLIFFKPAFWYSIFHPKREGV